MKKKKSKFKFKQRLYLASSLVFLLIIIFSSFQFYKLRSKKIDSAFLSIENKTIYPTLYSDKHITKNAIDSNPKFRNTITFNRENLTANSRSYLKKSDTFISSAKIENGTWLWTPILQITPEYQNSIIAGAKKNGITSIYLSIDSYLDIYIMPEGSEKTIAKNKFNSIIADFITEARKSNIMVDAEGGWRNWAEAGNEYKAFAVIDYAIEFNKTHEDKFRGFQYDIEPYMLAAYQKDKKSVLKNFVNLVNESVMKLDGADLEFSVVIPEFYDGVSPETPLFFYAGKLAYTFDHLLRVLDQRPGSKIIMMSYRNSSSGVNGSIEISKDEIARANKSETKIVIAQETGDVEPRYLTFFNTSKSKFDKELASIEKAFEGNASFKGTAVHYINAFMELR